MSLDTVQERCIELGADEFICRSCETDIHVTPNKVRKWQALVKHMNRTKVWGVGIHEDAQQAQNLACRDFINKHGAVPVRRRRRRKPA